MFGKSTKLARCPFEEKAEKESKIIVCEISESLPERIGLMQWAFEKLFDAEEPGHAIRFILPIDRNAVKTWDKARVAFYKYQIDMFGCQLYRHLWPLLSIGEPIEVDELAKHFARLEKERPGLYRLGQSLRSHCNAAGFTSGTVTAIIQLLLQIYEKIVAGSFEDVMNLKSSDGQALLQLGLHGITVYADNEHESKDLAFNRNCYYVVKCPLYEANTWRHSPFFELYVWRQADHLAVNPKLRDEMRIDSNTLYANAGVEFTNIFAQTPPRGFWIPKMRE
jgi:hypothetical protein